jgi:hypothetical protein
LYILIFKFFVSNRGDRRFWRDDITSKQITI